MTDADRGDGTRVGLAPRAAGRPGLSVPAARGIAFALLALFASLHWMALLFPAQPARALLALLIAGGVAVGLLAAGRLPGRARLALAVLVVIAAFVLALLAGGVSSQMLRPYHWGDLAAGISRGIGTLPAITVPYRGVDPWVRLVVPVGGCVLVVAAAAAAFWPRRDRLGSPALALTLLVTLYAVPAVAMVVGAEFLRGAVLAVLVIAFLRLERLRLPDIGPAAWLAVCAAILGMMAAPLIDEKGPWFDYETWALEASASQTTSYSWNHTYGPLNWPRDGREMLRVRARRPAYWKAENLDIFDGTDWVHGDSTVGLPDSVPRSPTERRNWLQTIHVTIENLRSEQFVTGGYTTAVNSPGIPARMQGDGTYTPTRPLVRGDSYTATIYSPQPTPRQRHLVPATDTQPVWPYLRLMLPKEGPNGFDQRVLPVDFPRYGEPGRPRVVATDAFEPGDDLRVWPLLHRGPFAGVWRLVHRLERGTNDEEDYVENVLRYLGNGFTYTESPPLSARTLPGFLMRAKTGYCQQYSGAMALLLRMGGVPARVSTGFTSGAYDTDSHEYVVRDLDAHSWVEAWYPTIGWVTFDPTPAVAPPRAQPEEAGTVANIGKDVRPPNLGADKTGVRGASFAVTEAGTPWWRTPLIIVGAVALAAAALLAWRRARRPATPALTELERALLRTRGPLRPSTTLRTLEASFAGSPAAVEYVRAIRDARFGGRPVAPTRIQRAALRHELARGGGLGARLRAWWALPPRRA